MATAPFYRRRPGPGHPAEEIPRAFERFHLRRRVGRGSPDGAGLGLAIVRELTEAMGGSVESTTSRAAAPAYVGCDCYPTRWDAG